MGQLETTFDFSLPYLMSHVTFWKTELKKKKKETKTKGHTLSFPLSTVETGERREGGNC